MNVRSRMLFWSSLWKNPKMENLSTQDRYLYLYTQVGPRSNLSGCYEISLRRIAFDTALGLDDIRAGLERLSDLELVWYNFETRELFIVDGLRQVFTGAPKGNRRIEREVANIKDFVFRILVRSEYLRLKAASERQEAAGRQQG